MERNKEKRDSQVEKEQPGDMASFNNRDRERSAETEGARSKGEGDSMAATEDNQHRPASVKADEQKK